MGVAVSGGVGFVAGRSTDAETVPSARFTALIGVPRESVGSVILPIELVNTGSRTLTVDGVDVVSNGGRILADPDLGNAVFGSGDQVTLLLPLTVTDGCDGRLDADSLEAVAISATAEQENGQTSQRVTVPSGISGVAVGFLCGGG
jgi:hypothetical protein